MAIDNPMSIIERNNTRRVCRGRALRRESLTPLLTMTQSVLTVTRSPMNQNVGSVHCIGMAPCTPVRCIGSLTAYCQVERFIGFLCYVGGLGVFGGRANGSHGSPQGNFAEFTGVARLSSPTTPDT